MTQRSWDNLDYINFGSTIAVSIEVNKYSEARYVVLLLVTTLGKFQFYVRIFAHSTTPINEVCLEPLSPSCRHGVKSVFLLGQPNGLRFSYIRSRSVETRSSSSILHFWNLSVKGFWTVYRLFKSVVILVKP